MELFHLPQVVRFAALLQPRNVVFRNVWRGGVQDSPRRKGPTSFHKHRIWLSNGTLILHSLSWAFQNFKDPFLGAPTKCNLLIMAYHIKNEEFLLKNGVLKLEYRLVFEQSHIESGKEMHNTWYRFSSTHIHQTTSNLSQKKTFFTLRFLPIIFCRNIPTQQCTVPISPSLWSRTATMWCLNKWLTRTP